MLYRKNALCLLFYGLIRLFAALFVPLIKVLICYLINLVSSSHVVISAGADVFYHLIPSIAFIVAAYIMYRGIYLQDEVDHTV